MYFFFVFATLATIARQSSARLLLFAQLLRCALFIVTKLGCL